MTRKSWALLALALVSACAPNNTYKPWRVGSFGYVDEVRGENRWYIKSLTAQVPVEYTSAMALYRAAIIAKASGFEYFHAVSFIPSYFESGISEEARLTAVGSHTPEGLVCEDGGRFAKNCKTYKVEDVFAQFGPLLGQTNEMQLAEIAAYRADSAE